MEAIYVIGIIVIIYILLNIQALAKETNSDLKDEISSLNKKIERIQTWLEQHPPGISSTNEELSAQQKAAAEAKALEEQRERIAALEKLRIEREAKKKEAELLAKQETFKDPLQQSITNATITQPITQTEPVIQESWWDKWVRNNPDIEKFIGENLINKIGIAVLVLGIAFFVKYAIDKNWIKEWGRVAIGIGCGALLIAIAHYLRKNYRSFSSVLVGGGLAVFYFTIAFAFHQYQLISQTQAFIVMLVITAFAVILSLLYDRLEVAVLAAIGGFITPFLVTNGSGNYIALFSYLIILNVGLLILSYFKKWPLINILSLFFTVIIYGSWMTATFAFSEKIPPYKNALIFATVFYGLFLAMNMIHNIRYQKPFKAFDFFILLLINCSYYTAGMIELANLHNGQFKGIFTIGMAAVNFALAFYFFKTHKGDKNLLYLLIGLTLSFVSLAAPVQLHGHSITLFWSAEAVLLYWLHQRSQIRIFKYSSSIVTFLMMASLLMDWGNAYWNSTYQLPVMFTNQKGIITNLVVATSFMTYYFLLRKEKSNDPYLFGTTIKAAKISMATLSILLLYVTCIFGVNLHFADQPDFIRINPYHFLITCLFVIILSIIVPKITARNAWPQVVGATVVYIFFLLSSDFIFVLRDRTLTGAYPNIHLIVHWITDVCVLYLFYKTIRLFRTDASLKPYTNSASWFICIAIVIFFSLECMHVYVSIFYKTNNIDTLQSLYEKAGLTILWAVCSFIMMWLGMKYSYKTLRIISLTIFSIALLKLFLFDIREISEGGKIAAFILLGVLLLTISFMYQKLKKIIIDDKIE